MSLWTFILKRRAALLGVPAVFFAGIYLGGRNAEEAYLRDDLKAVREEVTKGVKGIGDLGTRLAELDKADADRAAGQKEKLDALDVLIRRNRPPADGCRLSRADIERLRPLYEAVNAARSGDVPGGADADAGEAPASANAREAAAHSPE